MGMDRFIRFKKKNDVHNKIISRKLKDNLEINFEDKKNNLENVKKKLKSYSFINNENVPNKSSLSDSFPIKETIRINHNNSENNSENNLKDNLKEDKIYKN